MRRTLALQNADVVFLMGALVGDGNAIVGQLNQALAGRQWFYPKDTPWRQTITQKAAEKRGASSPPGRDHLCRRRNRRGARGQIGDRDARC